MARDLLSLSLICTLPDRALGNGHYATIKTSLALIAARLENCAIRI